MSKPNILLLTIDTLRADYLGCYDHPKNITPNIDKLAARGVTFTQAITGGSWTQAAFPVIMTSSYASMYGGCLSALGAERPSPISQLASGGYKTAGFSTSPLLSRQYGYDRGFTHFEDLIPAEKDPKLRQMKGGQRLLRQPLVHTIGKMLGAQTRPAKLYDTAADLTERLTGWIGKQESPYFAWAHYMDVHWPYHLEETLETPKEIAQAWNDLAHLHAVNWHDVEVTEAQKAHYIKLYEEAVRYTDAQIGRLLDYLTQSQQLENTIVIVVADHGEEFMEHGRWGHWENNLHDEILRVPLIVSLPDSQGSRTVARQVRLVDLMPTILEMANCDLPKDVEGRSLVPLWQGNGEGYKAAVSVSEMWRDEWHIIAVRTERYKYIWDSQDADNPILYDLQEDPREKSNISWAHPKIVREMHAYVEERLRRMAETKPAFADDQPAMDDELMSRLRGLGYVE